MHTFLATTLQAASLQEVFNGSITSCLHLALAPQWPSFPRPPCAWHISFSAVFTCSPLPDKRSTNHQPRNTSRGQAWLKVRVAFALAISKNASFASEAKHQHASKQAMQQAPNYFSSSLFSQPFFLSFSPLMRSQRQHGSRQFLSQLWEEL